MNVQHYHLPPKRALVSTYLSVLRQYDQVMQAEVNENWDHPGAYTASSDTALTVELYHGRFDPKADMPDWGFDGPIFNCLTLAHDTDRMLLQGCDSQSLELARRTGLSVNGDTITLEYAGDVVKVPNFRDGQPAYFGDHSATATEN